MTVFENSCHFQVISMSFNTLLYIFFANSRYYNYLYKVLINLFKI